MFQAAQQQLPEQPVLRTLNPHQNATVTTISEIIIPQTDTPGAKGARVNEFIDLIVTEWYDDEEKSIFLTGLTEIDASARSLFGQGFCGLRGKIADRNSSGLWMMKWLPPVPRCDRGSSRSRAAGTKFLFHDQAAHANRLLHFAGRF